MIITILTLIIISCISVIFVNQIVPLEYIKDKIGIGHNRRLLKSNYLLIDWFIFTIWKLSNCPGCVAYWLTLIYFQNIEALYLGAVSYIISTLIYQQINKISF